MDPAAFIVLVIIVVLSLAFSFLCSILEAALLSATVAELTERSNGGDKGAALLLDLKQNHIDNSISAILTLNTIAHTVGAALSGAQAAIVFGDKWVGAFSGVLTVLILVFTEIIPKTLGTVYGVKLAGPVGKTIKGLIFILKPILFVTHFLTSLVARGEKKPVSRGELLAMVQIAQGEGTLDEDDTRVLTNILRFDELDLRDIMTPRTVIVMLSADTPAKALLDNKQALVFSRIPIFEGTRDNVVGYILTREILEMLARGQSPERPLGELKRDLLFMPGTVSLDDAMEKIVDRREHMAILVGEHGGVNGLVTLEDIVETVFGTEIMDELDKVADLRQLALSMRARRMERLGLEEVEPSDEDAKEAPDA